MKLYNTLTRKKEEFVPLEPGRVSIYACGPTVYNYIHIGNARPLVTFDVLRNYFVYKGYDVTFVQNFTDIDDKIIQRAQNEDTSFQEIASRFIEEFSVDTAGLGLGAPDIAPKATETMDEIITMVAGLVENKMAYESGGDVYFRSRKFKDYGKLSGQPLDELNTGARVDASEKKEDPLDFAVWKAAKEGEPYWHSPWGNGRPGWHIECSAMVHKHLGTTIDIHGGGLDLIFPHHENEIAQSQSYNNAPYVRYWMHNGYINVDNHKMSKSLDNFFTVRDIAEQVGYEPIKYLMLQAHYRSPINFNKEILEQCVNSLERLHNCRDNIDHALTAVDDTNTAQSEEFLATLQTRRHQFETAMDDDLNTADGLAAIFELVRDINLYLTQSRPEGDLHAAATVFDNLTKVVGLLYNRTKVLVDGDIEALIEERQQARADKNFARGDEIRDQLREQGIVLEDTPQGVKYYFEK